MKEQSTSDNSEKLKTPCRSTNTPISLIQSLLDDASAMPHREDAKLDALRRRAKMILSQVFGPSSSYLGDLNKVSFYPFVSYPGMEDYHYDNSWKSGKSRLINLLRTAIEELELRDGVGRNQVTSSVLAGEAADKVSTRIFVVHGHDDEMKQAVTRLLEKLGLEPIVLHERPDKGRTVIEKFTYFLKCVLQSCCFLPMIWLTKYVSSPNQRDPEHVKMLS